MVSPVKVLSYHPISRTTETGIPMLDEPFPATIRFSCDCGAAFEVTKEHAGRLGRCGRCGREFLIPDTSEPSAAPPPQPPKPHVEPTLPSPAPQAVLRYCPFCGVSVREDTRLCPSCFKRLDRIPKVRAEQSDMTVVDWILSTVFAPLGCVGGFILLVMGSRKGLDMMGISTVAVFVWWCIALLVGWIR
jgi:hypothetical protein